MANIHSTDADKALRDGWNDQAAIAEANGDHVSADLYHAEAAKPGTIAEQPAPQPRPRS